MLIFGFADPAQRSSETHTASMLRLFARIFEASVVQSQLRRGNGELRITIEPLQALRRKKFFWIPILNFASAPHLERARVEVCDAADPAFLRENSIPKTIDTFADAGDGADSGDNRASSCHAATLFAVVST